MHVMTSSPCTSVSCAHIFGVQKQLVIDQPLLVLKEGTTGSAVQEWLIMYHMHDIRHALVGQQASKDIDQAVKYR